MCGKIPKNKHFHSSYVTKMTRLTLEKIFKPITFTCKILGMSPCYIKNKRFVVSKIGVLQTVTYLTTITLLTVYFVKNVKFNNNITRASFIKGMIILRRTGTITVTLLTTCFSYKKFVKFIHVGFNLTKLDAKLVELELQEQLSKENRRVQKTLTTWLILENLFLVGSDVLVTRYFIPTFDMLQIVIYIYPQWVIRTLSILFQVYAILIQARFKMVNQKFLEIRNDFCETVKLLSRLHTVLIKITRDVNSIFSPLLLLLITYKFLLLVGELHAATYVMFLVSTHRRFRVTFMSGKNCTLYVFEIYILVKRCISLCSEVS